MNPDEPRRGAGRARRRARMSSVAAGLLLAAPLFAGCSSDTPEDPYAKDIAAAKSIATSAFEKDVLADAKITPQEYDEAHQLWLRCMQTHYPEGSGIKVKLDRGIDGLYSYSVSGFPGGDVPEEYDEAFDSCGKGTTVLIAPLFNDMKTNPSHLTAAELIVLCLKASGAVPKSYTSENLRADEAKEGAMIISQDGSGKTVKSAAPVDQAKVTDLDMHDERVVRCHEDPTMKSAGG